MVTIDIKNFPNMKNKGYFSIQNIIIKCGELTIKLTIIKLYIIFY